MSQRISNMDGDIFLLLFFVVIGFVGLLSVVGFFYFKRSSGLSDLPSFMASLPGGLTFLMSLSDNLGESFPKVALIHTVRVVFLISFFSVFSFLAGFEKVNTSNTELAFSLDPMLWQVFAFAFIMKAFSDRVNIGGGQIIFPMIGSAFFYSQNLLQVSVPNIAYAMAMVCFGVDIGYRLNQAPLNTYFPYIKSSLVFSAFAVISALLISLGLSKPFEVHYFLLFLSLAPGSIAEISVIAMALGFDAGLVAIIHTFRFLLIMLIGSLGVNFFSPPETVPAKG